MDSATIRADVRGFVSTNFLFGQAVAIADDQSFLGSGLIDSTGMLELVAFLEERYGVAVADHELVPEHLDSLANVSAYILRKLAPGAS